MTTLERYNLVDDAWNAVVAGTLDAIEFLEFVERFGDEREYAVWQSIVIGLRGLAPDRRRRWRRPRSSPGSSLWSVRPSTNSANPPTASTDLTAKLRGLLLGAVAVPAATPTRTPRAAASTTLVGRPGSVDPELAAAATSVVAATGDAPTTSGCSSGTGPAARPRSSSATSTR